MDFYNKKLSQIKFTRDSVAEIRNECEAGRDLKLNISVLERKSDQETMRNLEKRKKQELQAYVPTLKKSDSSYLRKRFQVNSNKGLDHVRRENILGTNHEIEVETMNILRNNKKRFNKSVERRYEY